MNVQTWNKQVKWLWQKMETLITFIIAPQKVVQPNFPFEQTWSLLSDFQLKLTCSKLCLNACRSAKHQQITVYPQESIINQSFWDTLSVGPDLNPLSWSFSAILGKYCIAEMSVVWDPGQDWIQIFDRLLKHPQVSRSLKSQTDVPQEAKSGLGWMGWSPSVYQVFKNVTKTQSI